MRRLILAVLFAVLGTFAIGCAWRKPAEGLGKSADDIHIHLSQIIDAMPEDDPRRPQLVALLDKVGKHRGQCERVEEYWDLLNKALAAGDLLENGITFRIDAGAHAGAGQ